MARPELRRQVSGALQDASLLRPQRADDRVGDDLGYGLVVLARLTQSLDGAEPGFQRGTVAARRDQLRAQLGELLGVDPLGAPKLVLGLEQAGLAAVVLDRLLGGVRCDLDLGEPLVQPLRHALTLRELVLQVVEEV